MKVQFERKLQDMWIGAYWKRDNNVLHIWICFVPCFPLHIQLFGNSER